MGKTREILNQSLEKLGYEWDDILERLIPQEAYSLSVRQAREIFETLDGIEHCLAGLADYLGVEFHKNNAHTVPASCKVVKKKKE